MKLPNPLRVFSDMNLEDYPPGRVYSVIVGQETHLYLRIYNKPLNREIEGLELH